MEFKGPVKELVFCCCYCAEPMAKEEIHTVVLVWPNDDEQSWWGHRKCFEKSLHIDYRYFRDEEDEHEAED